MGKSRSATVVIAYLMQKHNINPSEALSQLRQARSICEPNDGFMNQLELYGEMKTPEHVEETPAYQRWVYQREIELSRACGQAPEADKIRFEDEHVTDQNSSFELRCRKCRSVESRHRGWKSLLVSCRRPTCSALTSLQTTTGNLTVSAVAQAFSSRQWSRRRSALSRSVTELCTLLPGSLVMDATRA